MSAFIVGKTHIDALVSAGEGRDSVRWWHENNSHQLTRDQRDAVGRMLWLENQRSVAYHYPNDGDGDWPGPTGLTLATIEGYIFTRSRAGLDLAGMLKQIDAYEYQSSEHPGWVTSEARAYCDGLRRYLICRLPGYENAPWGL